MLKQTNTILEAKVIDRAVLYARVSSDDTKQDGRNLKGQITLCREYAQGKGYQIVAELSEDDRGASGAEIDLPELTRIRDMAAAGEFDVLVVREIDRLSRNLAKQLIIEQELDRAGVQIEYALVNYEDTPEGRLSKHVRAVIAEYEREKISERTKRGRIQKVKSGATVTARAPYGYRLVNEDNRQSFEVVEAEAEIVRLIFQWFVYGSEVGQVMSFYNIAVRLSEMRIPTTWDKRANRHKKSKFGQWLPSTIKGILANETYIGRWHFGKKKRTKEGKVIKVPRDRWVTVAVPAIIDEALFDQAQQNLKESRRRSLGNKRHDYLLSGLCNCGACQRAMTGRYSPTKEGKKYFYYVCTYSVGKAPPIKCDYISYRVDILDVLIWEWVRGWLLQPEWITRAWEHFGKQQGQGLIPLQRELKGIESRLEADQAQLKRLVDLYLMEEIPLSLYLERKQDIEERINNAQNERAGLKQAVKKSEAARDVTDSLSDFAAKIHQKIDLMAADFGAKQHLLRLLRTRVKLALEDGEKVAYAACVLGGDRLLVNQNTSGRVQPDRQKPSLVISSRLLLYKPIDYQDLTVRSA